MSKLAKLLERMRHNPGSVRWSQFETVMLALGFSRRQPGGGSSHYSFTRGAFRFTVPRRGSKVDAVYVEQVIKGLDSTGFQEEEIEDERRDDG